MFTSAKTDVEWAPIEVTVCGAVCEWSEGGWNVGVILHASNSFPEAHPSVEKSLQLASKHQSYFPHTPCRKHQLEKFAALTSGEIQRPTRGQEGQKKRQGHLDHDHDANC